MMKGDKGRPSLVLLEGIEFLMHCLLPLRDFRGLFESSASWYLGGGGQSTKKGMFGGESSWFKRPSFGSCND